MMAFSAIFDVGEWQLQLANYQASRGRAGSAERLYRKVLAHRPDHPAALIGLGKILLKARQFEEAVEVWQKSAALGPREVDPAFQLARALHRSGRLEAAAKQYLRVLALDRTHLKATEALDELSRRLVQTGQEGVAALDAAVDLARESLAVEAGVPEDLGNAHALLAVVSSREDPEAAVRHWQEVARLNPKSIDAPLQIARLRRRQGRSAEANRFFRVALDLAPDHIDALTGYGQTLADSGDIAGAIRHFSDWADRQPREVSPYLELGWLHHKQGDLERTGAIHRDLVANLTRDQPTLSRLSRLLARHRARLDQALDIWQRIAERDGKSTFALVQRAMLLERAGLPEEAEADYRAALDRKPRDEQALSGLSRLLFGQSRWQEAAACYELLYRGHEGRTDALLGAGRCLERLDRTDEALRAYDKVAALDPANINAPLYRGRLLRQLGRTGEAIESWRHFCERSPGNTVAWHELIYMLASAERDDEAVAALGEAEASLPPTAGSWVELGLAAQAAQLDRQAVDYFERAIAADPQPAGPHARLGSFYARRGIVDAAFHHLLASRELFPGDVAVTRQLVDTVHTLDMLGIDHMRLEAAPRRSGEVLVPERLFDRVRNIADTQVVPYVPEGRGIVVVSSSLAGGGAERQVVNLLRGLAVPAFDLELALFCISLAPRSRRDFFLPSLAGLPIDIRTPQDSAFEDYLSAPEVAPHEKLIRCFPADMAVPIAFWLGEFRRRRPRVVHAWQDNTNLTAVVAALLAGVPRIVLGARSVRPDNPRRRLKRFMRDGYRAVLGHPSIVLTNNSQAGARDYAQWLDIDPAGIEVVHNGIDFDQLARSVDPARARKLRTDLGIPPDAPVVGGVFRMSEEKRPLLWVETAAAVARLEPRAHFVVYGTGPMHADMAERGERLGLGNRLHLPGAENDIASCYEAMDVVLLTSRHEGLPNTLLEAQSLGVPVVAPDVGGVAEAMWSGITGWAVTDADAPALANHVVRCLRDDAWRATAHREAPSLVRERFGIPAMLARTLEVYGLAGPDHPI